MPRLLTQEQLAHTPTPTVHLNGTGREGLVSQYRAAYDAVRVAIDAVAASCPHGRDYYTQGPEAYETARACHVRRLTLLTDVRDDLSGLLRRLRRP